MKFLKKRVALSLSMMLFCLGSFAATPGVVFLLKNGYKVCFAFSAKPEISVTTDFIKVSSLSQSEVSYLIADVLRFYFDDEEQTAIHGMKPAVSVPVFSYQKDFVTVSGLVADEYVEVHSLDGRKVASTEADALGCAKMDICNAPTGVYVVTTSRGVSFKLLKK